MAEVAKPDQLLQLNFEAAGVQFFVWVDIGLDDDDVVVLGWELSS